jgi:hypothetical protein
MDDTTKASGGKNNRVWLIGGVVLLQIIMLIAAFSLGVYFGRHGLSDEGLSYRGPGQPVGQPGGAPGRGQGQIPGGPNNPQQPQQGVQPQLQLPPGLTEPPQVIGRLAHMGPDAFEIIIQQGPRPILFDEETYFRDHEGNTISPDDLQQGFILAIYGNPSPDRQNLIATEVVLLPPIQEQPQQPAQP